MIYKNWAFTLQIPPFKQVNFDGRRVAFKNLDPEAQESYMRACIYYPGYAGKQEEKYEIFFERHADGRLHCHGTFFDMTQEEIEEAQSCICQFIGFPRVKQYNQIFNFLPIYNSIGWEKYCQKEQEPKGPRDDNKWLEAQKIDIDIPEKYQETRVIEEYGFKDPETKKPFIRIEEKPGALKF